MGSRQRRGPGGSIVCIQPPEKRRLSTGAGDWRPAGCMGVRPKAKHPDADILQTGRKQTGFPGRLRFVARTKCRNSQGSLFHCAQPQNCLFYTQ